MLFLFLLMNSCAVFSPARHDDPLTLTPQELPFLGDHSEPQEYSEQSEYIEHTAYTNRLVFNGHNFGLPEGWLFLRSPDRLGDPRAFTFSSSVTGSGPQGMVEFIDLETDKTGLTPALFISDLHEIALRRSESVTWELYSTAHNVRSPGSGNSVGKEFFYYLLKEVSASPTEYNYTVVVNQRNLAGEIVPISQAHDLLVFQFSCETCSHTPESLAKPEMLVFNFIAAHRSLGWEHNGRFIPEGPVFHELYGGWCWMSDRPGGFTLNYNKESDTETQYVVSIFKGNYEAEGETYRLGNFDMEIVRGNSWLSVGSTIVSLEFRTLFIPRLYTNTSRGTGRGFLYTQGKFTRNNTDYSLYIQQSVNLSFDDQGNPEQSDSYFKEIIFTNRELSALLQLYIESY